MMSAFLKNNTENHLFAPGDTIIVGVSGGADSLCLLHLLVQLQGEWNLTLIVAHANYGVRKAAQRDQELVAKFAKKHNLPLRVKKVHFTPARKKNFEEWARNERYKFFAKLAAQYKAQHVAVAHNKNDQAETVLMHFVRGAGLPGWSGMRMQEGKLIRPLLPFTRQEILAELRRAKIRYATDATNRDRTYLRNRLRHQLLPLLEKSYNPNIVETLVRVSQNATQIQAFLTMAAQEFIAKHAVRRKGRTSFPRHAWEAAPDALLHAVITLTCSAHSGRVEKLSNRHFAQVLSIFRPWRSGLTKELPAGLKITTERAIIAVQEQ